MHTSQDAAGPAQPNHNPDSKRYGLGSPQSSRALVALRALDPVARLRMLEQWAPDYWGDADFAEELEEARIAVHALREMTQPIPIACYARLVAARARRRPSEPTAELRIQLHCTGCCVCVPLEVWSALDRAHPDFPLEGPDRRQVLAARFAPLMAREGWKFCRCYWGHRPEHRFLFCLVDTGAANAAAALLAASGGAR